MTTPDVERRLAAVLDRHAEEAMSRTDTRAELGRLEQRISDESAVGPSRWVVVAAAVVATAAMALGVIWFSDVGRGASDSEPAHEDRSAQTDEERVAQRFAEAFAARDNERVETFLAQGATAPPGWRDYAAYAEAFSFEVDVQPCETTSVTEYGTFVDCLSYYHSLRSEKLGLGPFGPSVLTLGVADGKVRTFRLAISDIGSGEARLYAQIGAWVREQHPGEWAFLGAKWSLLNPPSAHDKATPRLATFSPSEVDRWVRLWQRRTQEYADTR